VEKSAPIFPIKIISNSLIEKLAQETELSSKFKDILKQNHIMQFINVYTCVPWHHDPVARLYLSRLP
jgi:hypothetical protein